MIFLSSHLTLYCLVLYDVLSGDSGESSKAEEVIKEEPQSESTFGKIFKNFSFRGDSAGKSLLLFLNQNLRHTGVQLLKCRWNFETFSR